MVRRTRFVRGLVVLGLLLAVSVGGYFGLRRSEPGPPAVALAGVDQAVAFAVEDARAAVRREPRSAATWGRLGMLLLAHQFPIEAEECFRRAEQLDDKDPRWSAYLGMVLSLKDADAALDKWRRALEQGGDRSPVLRLRLAEALLAHDRADEASACFRQLLADKPGLPLAHLGLARAAYDRGDWQDALAHLGSCSSNPFTRKAAHTLAGSIHLRRGDIAAADRERAAAASLPDDVEWPDPFADDVAQLRLDKRSRLAQADKLLAQGRVPEALSTLNRLLREHPDFDPAWRALAYLLLQQRDYPAAERALFHALRLEPDSPEAHYYLGCVALNQEKLATAAASFRKATDLKPDYALAHYNLGLTLARQGDRPGALAAFRAAVRNRPYFAEAHRGLGELLAQDGKKDEAITHLKNAVEMNPADEPAKKLLSELQGPGPLRPPGR